MASLAATKAGADSSSAVGRNSNASSALPPEVEKALAGNNECLADYFAIVGLNDELKPLDAGYDCKCNFLKIPTRIKFIFDSFGVSRDSHY